jgi:beta-lactamase class A
LRGVEDQRAFEANLNNEVTANGLLKMLRLIADGKAYSQHACDEMLEIMLDQQYRSGIPAGLPKAARVAHKTGNISTVHHDAGIVYLEGRKPYVLVILTQFGADQSRGTAVADVSRDIFNTLAGSHDHKQ